MQQRATAFILLLAVLFPSTPTFAGLFDDLQYRNVGPSRGGRVTAVAGTVQESGTFYLGASGGGLWKSTDYGQSWANVSDGFFASPSIGDIAVSQSDPNILYVATGSDGLRSNVIGGKGVYRSADGGVSWTLAGLEDSGHIGAVEIDPRNNNVVWVAAIGQAFSASEQRGVYRSSDGGASWERSLAISDTVGFSDLELLPHNPDVVFATAWRARRTPWTIISGGTQEQGGLYKSADGGKNWRRISEGLPTGLIGKMDLAVSPADSRVVYLLVEAPGDKGGLYRSDDQGESFRQVSDKAGLRTRPFYYGNVEADPGDPDTVYVLATRYYRSRDGGQSWEELHPPHGDSHDMWINPENPDLFIQANDGGANVTFNGGDTWSTQFNQATAELYQVEVDDQYPYWLYAGQQDNRTTIAVPSRAPYRVQSRDAWLIETGGCETGPAVPKPGNADIVYVNCKGRFGVFDKRTGTQRNYFVGAANMYGQNPVDLRYRFQRVAPVHVSPHDPDTVYHASQFVHRSSNDGVTWQTISPDLTAFEADKQVISGAPITRDITGEEFYSTIYSLRESPLQEGLIWTGANDGPVYVTRDGGEDWRNVTPKMPSGGRVDSVAPSPHDAATATIAVHRYLLGDWKPYIYRTESYGRRWTLLTNGRNGIPADHPVRVVREDPVVPGLLYAGTEYGLFVSLNGGDSWQPLQQNLPVTPVTDIRIFRDDIVLSTMGRGFWILDKGANTLRQVAALDGADSPVLLTPSATVRYRQNFTRDEDDIPQYPKPAALIEYYLPPGSDGELRLEVFDEAGQLVNAFRSEDPKVAPERESDMALNRERLIEKASLVAVPGLHRFAWDLRHRGAWHKDRKKRYASGPLVLPGTYRVRLTHGDRVMEQTLQVHLDPRGALTGVTDGEREAQLTMQLQLRDLLERGRRLAHDLEGRDEASRLSEAETRVLKALVTGKGTYMPPGLLNQISYLEYMLRGSDQDPGDDARARYAELARRFEELEAAIR